MPLLKEITSFSIWEKMLLSRFKISLNICNCFKNHYFVYKNLVTAWYAQKSREAVGSISFSQQLEHLHKCSNQDENLPVLIYID